MTFFQFFPQVEYGSETATNIMCRSKIRDVVRQNAAVFYSYTIKDGERPDIVATKYYGSPKFTWLIFYANDIFDPIFDWPLDEQGFQAHLAEKYRSRPDEADVEVVRRCYQTVHHSEDEDGFWVNVGVPVSVYDWEHFLNERKRDIKIIDKSFAVQIMNEMRVVFD